MLLLSKENIEEVFTMRDSIETNKEAYKLFSMGKSEVPLRTVIPAPKEDGTFLFMPSYVEDLQVAGLKVVNIFPNNAKDNLPTAPAEVLLINGKTGIIESILDGTYVTQLRTGASSGVAFDLLAKKDSKIGAIIGCGSQAKCQIDAMVESCNLEEVRVYSRNSEKRDEFVNSIKDNYKNTKIISVISSDEAIKDADIIVTVTPSTTPVFDATKVKKGATISCVGSYQHNMQEMDPKTLTMASKIYFDSKEAVLSEAGDITIPLEEGTIKEEDFTGDIGDLLLGNIVGRENNEEIIVYKNVGIGVLDLLTANNIYKKAVDKNIGTSWK